MLWGLPLVAIAAWPNVGVAIAALALVGVGNTLVDVAGFTLLQRIAPDDVLARVFGVVETVFYLAIGIGSLLAPLLVETAGARWALVAVGLFLPVVVLWRGPGGSSASTRMPSSPCTSWSCSRSWRCSRRCRSSRSSALPGNSFPWRQPRERTSSSRATKGDRFYVIDEGEVDVVADGRHIGSFGRGYGFGEIALLRDVPRTATVTARTPVKLYALERDAFLAAVTGHSASQEAADALIVSRMSSIRS